MIYLHTGLLLVWILKSSGIGAKVHDACLFHFAAVINTGSIPRHIIKFHYIVVNKGKKDFITDDTDQMETIRKTDDYTIEVNRLEKDNEAVLLCHSTARAGKDYGIRNRQETIFLERLQYFHDGLSRKNRTKSYPKIIEMIGRLREKYPKASKLYDVEVVPKSGTHKSIKATAILWNKRDKYKEINKFDGCYVLRTDRLDLSDKEIWETYIMLTRIEGAFRSMKSHLGLRPIFHQNEILTQTSAACPSACFCLIFSPYCCINSTNAVSSTSRS